ncbi:MAG: RNA 2',3'-cyclic phosphodiesterase [Archaeoglobaceae archaeon]
MRLFVAVDLDEKLKGNIEPLLSRLSRVRGLKVVEKENLHTTLMFLGEVNENMLENLKQALSRVKFKPFQIKLKGTGKFPEKGNPRVLWVGIKEGSGELSKLADSVYSELKKFGFQRDKDFRAHITVARVKKRDEEIEAIIKDFKNQDFGEMLVKEFKLKQSILTQSGPLYRDVFIFECEYDRGNQ